MMLKHVNRILIVAGTLSLGAQLSYASSGFENTVNTQLGNGASVSCNACHSGSQNASTAILPMATTYKSARSAGNFALLASSDSDGDGFTNAQEVSGSLVRFNDSAVSPFTLLTGQAFTGTNIKAVADASAAETTFTDPQGLATTGTSILGGVKVTLNQTDTVYFKAGGVSSTATVYVVDATGAGTALGTTDWTSNVDGSLKLNALPAGSNFPADLVVVSAGATAATAVSNSGTASVTGCMTSGGTLPLMVLSLLGFSLLLRRKSVI